MTSVDMTNVMVNFYLQNDFDSTVTLSLSAYDTLGWSISPDYWETTLNADEHDSAVLTVSVPDVMTGTQNRIYLAALTATFLELPRRPKQHETAARPGRYGFR